MAGKERNAISKRKNQGRETTSSYLHRLYTLEKPPAYEATNTGIPPPVFHPPISHSPYHNLLSWFHLNQQKCEPYASSSMNRITPKAIALRIRLPRCINSAYQVPPGLIEEYCCCMRRQSAQTNACLEIPAYRVD